MTRKSKKTKSSDAPKSSELQESDIQELNENAVDDENRDAAENSGSDTIKGDGNRTADDETDADVEGDDDYNDYSSDADLKDNDAPGGAATIYRSIADNRNYQIGLGAIVLLTIILIALGFYNSGIQSDLKAMADEKAQMSTQLADAEKKLQSADTVISTEKQKLSKAEEAFEATQTALQDQIEDLESTLQNAKSTVGELKNKKKQALIELAQFKRFSTQFQKMIDSGKLEVVFRRGRMVVNLPAQVLFDSGSAGLTEEGLAALKEVAKILKTVRNRRFMVGGHTDNRKIVKADFDSNWELASARAINVTRELVKAGLPPKNLIAAGYSQYAPIASNATDAGRQKNRRIEIILEPFLKDLPSPIAAKKSKKARNKTADNKKKKSKKKAVKSS